jgi:hypothetical protein
MQNLVDRRSFLAAVSTLPLIAARASDLEREVGITTSSFQGHLGPNAGQIALLDLPRMIRDEFGMRVIDLNTNTLGTLDPAALNRFREAAAKSGCVLTNLKMNQREIDIGAADPEARRYAIAEYKRAIDAAALLGCRWARPLPRANRPDFAVYVAGYRELADYALSRKVQMLVENFGWMESDPEAIPRVVAAVARNIAASPDTGNWTDNSARYKGLAAAFPITVTCDFKAKTLEPNGEHRDYDLKRCFQLGWNEGFKGPWCLEILDPDRPKLFKNLLLVRDRLRSWMEA